MIKLNNKYDNNYISMHTITLSYEKTDFSGYIEKFVVYLFSTEDKVINFVKKFIKSYNSKDHYYCELNQKDMFMEILLGINLEFINIKYEKLKIDSENGSHNINCRDIIRDSCFYKNEYEKFLNSGKNDINLITKEMFKYYFNK